MSSTNLILSLLVAVLGGGGLWAVVGKWLDLNSQRKGKSEDSELAWLREHTAKQTTELAVALSRIAAIEDTYPSAFPRWFKDQNKRITWINDRAYLAIFAPCGYSQQEVIGKTFAELLDPNAAAEIDKLDISALASPGTTASNLIKLNAPLPEMHVVKVVTVGRGIGLVYEGLAYNVNDAGIERAVRAEK